MNLYIIAGLCILGAVVTGLYIWRSKWLFGKAKQLGEAQQRATEADASTKAVEDAQEAEREIANIMVERRDTSATRKKLQNGEF